MTIYDFFTPNTYIWLASMSWCNISLLGITCVWSVWKSNKYLSSKWKGDFQHDISMSQVKSGCWHMSQRIKSCDIFLTPDLLGTTYLCYSIYDWSITCYIMVCWFKEPIEVQFVKGRLAGRVLFLIGLKHIWCNDSWHVLHLPALCILGAYCIITCSKLHWAWQSMNNL